MPDPKLPAAIEAAIDRLADASAYEATSTARGYAYNLLAASTARAALVDAIAAHLAPAAPLTVGAALALPEVARDEAVVEYIDAAGLWWQAGSDGYANEAPHVSSRPFSGEWCFWTGSVTVAHLSFPCRLVPLADADRDPASRGTL